MLPAESHLLIHAPVPLQVAAGLAAENNHSPLQIHPLFPSDSHG